MRKCLVILGLVLVFNLLAVPAVTADENTFSLDEVVVTASKYEEELSNTAVSMEVVNQAEIEQKNAQNAADLLRDVSSVQINDQGGITGLKTVSIRGANAKNVLVLVDGQEMNNLLTGVADLSQFPIEQIKRIEILKGPASAIYGADTLGGVVNIITKSGSQKPITKLDVKTASYDTQKFNLTHRQQVKNLAYNLAITKVSSDGHRDNSGLEQRNLFTRFDYTINNYTEMIASIQYDDSDKEVPGPSNDPSPQAEQDDENTKLNLQWKKQTEGNDLKAAVYYNEHNQVYDNPALGNPPSKHDSYKKGIELVKTDYYSNNTLTYGLEVKENRIDSTEAGKHEHLNKSLFINDDWQVLEDVKLTASGRYDDHEKFGSNFSPRLGTVYDISKGLNWHLSVGEAYVTPTFTELYWGKWSNPDLKPESAVAYETGVRFKNNFITGEVNYFKKDVNNFIAWDDAKEESYNIDKVNTSGIELILDKRLNKRLSANLNYTYTDARDDKTEERLEDKPYHKANLDLTYEREDLNLLLSGKYTGERESSYWDPNTFKTVETTLPSHFIVDLKVSNDFEIKEQKVNLSFGINNLFDKDYAVIEKYPMPERNYMLSTELKF